MLSVTKNQDDFSESVSWLESQQIQYGLKLGVLSGEFVEVPDNVIQNPAKWSPDMTKHYTLKDIFYADETGIYDCPLPSHSKVVKTDT